MSTRVRPARISVAIRRPDDDAILVLADGSLPSFELHPSSPWQLVAPVNEAMSAAGLTVTTLRAAWLGVESDARLYEAVLLSGAVPGRASWVTRADLPDGLTADRVGSDVRRAIADGALTATDGSSQPWYMPGWLAEMGDWIDARLRDAGLRRHGPLRQMRSWGRSALFQVETDRGLIWAKEVPVRFAHEIAVTGLLADLDPGLVPPLIAADPAAGRLLTAHVDGPLLVDVEEPTAWTATLARLAETQRVLAAERGRLVVAGVVSAPLDTLASEIPGLLEDRELLRVGEAGGMTETDWSTLRGHATALQEACRGLAASGVPDSLDHGDLSAAQVIVGEMGPVIFDWSDATITHPFLALAAFDADESGTQAYLDAWQTGLSPSAVHDAVRAARLVEPLHLARSFRDRILPGLEQPWELDRVVPARLTDLVWELEHGHARAAR